MMRERHTGESVKASHNISINYLVSQSHIYQTPLVHDSPASRTQSSIEDLVPQTSYKVYYVYFRDTILKQSHNNSTVVFLINPKVLNSNEQKSSLMFVGVASLRLSQ